MFLFSTFFSRVMDFRLVLRSSAALLCRRPLLLPSLSWKYSLVSRCAWCWCCGFSVAAAIFFLDSSPPLMRYPARLLRLPVRRASFRPSVARFSTLPSVQRLVSWPCTDWSASFGIIVRGCRRVRLLLFAHRRFLLPSISALSRSEFARFLGLC